MNISKILIPHHFQIIGWLMFIPFAFLTYLTAYFEFQFSFLDFSQATTAELFDFQDRNLTNEVAIIGLFLSLFFISFSKEKKEDEYIQKLRLDSILIACYGYFLLNILGVLLFFGFDYLSFVIFNMFSIPLIFIIRFRWVMFRQLRNVGMSL